MKTISLLGTLLFSAVAFGQAPWVDKAMQKRNEVLMQWAGVEIPQGLRFYEMRQAFQHVARGERFQPVYLLCDAKYKLISNGTNVNSLPLWRDSGGLSNSPKEQWRNARGVVLPQKMTVWKGSIRMPNAGDPLPIYQWSYPDGTVFIDMLIRIGERFEWPFEIRMREKKDGKWQDGVAYRPFTNFEELPQGSRKATWTLGLHKGEDARLLGVDDLKFTAWAVPDFDPAERKGKFKASRLVATSNTASGYFPQYYAGTMVSCNKCHNLAGHSSAYAEVFRGSDTIFSLSPFDESSVSTNGMARQIYFNPELVDSSSGLPFGRDNRVFNGFSTLQLVP